MKLKRKLWRWGALLGVGAFSFGILLVTAILNPIQTQMVQSANEETNLADELLPILREQGERWGFDWTLWAAYWGNQRWQLPIRSRLERLQAAREFNYEQMAQCQQKRTKVAQDRCRQSATLKPTDRGSIEAEWGADARAYLENQLRDMMGAPPTTTEKLATALEARVTSATWEDVQGLHEVYSGVVELQEEDSEGWVELTEGEDYTLYLRVLDWEYLFPVQGAYTAFNDSWGDSREQNDLVGASERHHGTDIMAPRGTPLVAVADGEVEKTEWNFLGGWTILLLGDDGLRYYYAHMNGPSHLKAGDTVRRGEIVGEVGDSGEGPEGTTGKVPPHLHFGIYTSDKGTVTNPYRYLLRWAGIEDTDHMLPIMPVEPPPNWRPVDGFAWPAAGSLTSTFGMRTSPIDGQRRLHAGIDLGVAYSTPVRASKAGEVAVAEWSDVYGWYVVVDHGNYSTLYAHNSKLAVKVRDRVEQGQLVALSGSTGWSTGPHLHFEIHFEGAPIDPLLLLPN